MVSRDLEPSDPPTTYILPIEKKLTYQSWPYQEYTAFSVILQSYRC